MLSGMLQNLQGLQGLQANQVKMDEFQTQKMNRSKATELLRSYQETQDPAKLNEAILLDGELANNVLVGIGIQDKARMQRAADDYIALTGSLGNKEQFNQLAAKRLDNILAAGGNPSDTLAVVKAYNEQGPEAAKAMLQPVGAALVNKGVLRADLFGAGGAESQDPTSVKEIEYYEKLKAKNPQLAEQFARKVGLIESGKEQAQSEAQKDWQTYQSLKKENPEAALQFGQKVGFVSKEGRELSAQTQKRLSEFNDAATLAANNVVKYEDLASQFDQGVEGGVIDGSWGEYFADLTGQQDWKTELRKDFAQVRASEAVRNLPPGAASDADIALALKPFPSDNATGAQVASFLRGLSKLSAYNEKYNSFKANYISEKGSERGMLDAWKQYAKENDIKPVTVERTLNKPVQIGGYTVVEVDQ